MIHLHRWLPCLFYYGLSFLFCNLKQFKIIWLKWLQLSGCVDYNNDYLHFLILAFFKRPTTFALVVQRNVGWHLFIIIVFLIHLIPLDCLHSGAEIERCIALVVL